MMLSTKGAGFIRLEGNSKRKLSFYKVMYGNSAILCQLVKGFSHYFVVFMLLLCLLGLKNLFDIG